MDIGARNDSTYGGLARWRIIASGRILSNSDELLNPATSHLFRYACASRPVHPAREARAGNTTDDGKSYKHAAAHLQQRTKIQNALGVPYLGKYLDSES